MAVSLAPKTFVESGLLDDADVEITDAAFCIWNYQGKSADILALGIEYTELSTQPDGTRKKHEQFYSAGDLQYFRPSPDGATMEPVSDKTAMNSNTNAAQFLSSVVKAGFPESNFEAGSCKVLKGLKVHVNRIAQPKRPGLVKAEGEKEKTVLLVSRILTGAQAPAQPSAFGNAVSGPTQGQLGMHPAQSPAAPAASPLTAAPAQPSVPAANGVAELTQATLINILAQSGGKLAKMKLPGAAFKLLVGNPQQSEVVSLIFNDQFLMTCEGVTFDGQNVSMA